MATIPGYNCTWQYDLGPIKATFFSKFKWAIQQKFNLYWKSLISCIWIASHSHITLNNSYIFKFIKYIKSPLSNYFRQILHPKRGIVKKCGPKATKTNMPYIFIELYLGQTFLNNFSLWNKNLAGKFDKLKHNIVY